MNIQDFGSISKLPPNGSLPATIGIDFNDTTQPVNLEIICSLGETCLKKYSSIVFFGLISPLLQDGFSSSGRLFG